MAKSKKNVRVEEKPAAPVSDIGIVNILETNYMPYAMSVIVSRAIPEIDGFKPAHRKLLYTMYKMGLMTGAKTKSAKVVGQTMMLNPHGDGAIYETLVRLTTGKEALLHPFVESKGSFGKQYSDMAYAASRYTEVKLAPFCAEIFDGIDRDAVDMVDNYDGTMKEPAILPVSFPNVLVSPNTGIAVGMASTICSFNLGEICDVTTAFIQNESITCDEMLDILKAPDFSTGGLLLYDREKLKEIYTTGRGSFKVRAKYTYDKAANRIEVTQIPYTTTLEKIKSVIVSLVKNGRIKEIADVRDETDLNGLKLTIDLKRGSDSEKLMARLFKLTPLEDDFACNFNILVGGTPMTLGIREILDEWAAFRVECLRRTFIYDLEKKSDKLHLLYGLKEILLDIDLAISIIRNTETEKEVVPNLMAGFGIDEKQAEYVADIKLRNINREYIVNRISEIDELEKETAELRELIADDRKIKKVIVRQLKAIKAKYAIPRKTFILYEDDVVADVQEETVEDYPVVAFLSREGYFKKCTLASLRGNDVQKFKENDALLEKWETSNAADVLFFTSKAQVYKSHLYDFEDSKASLLGDYVPAKLSFEPDERVVAACCLKDYGGSFTLFFENGKAGRIPASSYETKTNRRKLVNAFFAGSPVVGLFRSGEGNEYLLLSNASKALLVREEQITDKTTKTSSGASVFTLRRNGRVVSVRLYGKDGPRLVKEAKYRKAALPSAGTLFEDDDPELTQQTLL